MSQKWQHQTSESRKCVNGVGLSLRLKNAPLVTAPSAVPDMPTKRGSGKIKRSEYKIMK